MRRMAALAVLFLSSAFLFAQPPGKDAAGPAGSETRWPAARANQWLDRQGWLVGCNYLPATAINQLEMWQADTWDPTTIDRELGWAENLGFTSVRVFLHDLAWRQDRNGCIKRVDEFLNDLYGVHERVSRPP